MMSDTKSEVVTGKLEGRKAQAELKWVEYGKLVASKTNPRKDFNKEALEELRSSIAEHGIKQPLIVRPIAEGKFEVIAGERRYRAAGLAKLALVPCLVEVMDDKTALEIQAIENLQREDLNAIEEAQGYKALQDAGYSIDELIKQTGKSRSRVFARLQLLKLSGPVQKAMQAGKLDRSKAEVIATVADPKSQEALLEMVEDDDYEVRSYKGMKEFVARRYQRSLREAVFSQEKVYEGLIVLGKNQGQELKSWGACAKCPRRSGNIGGFDGSADVCTWLPCYEEKSRVEWGLKRAEALKAGQKVMTREEWEKVRYSSVYVKLSDVPHDTKGKFEGKSWKSLLKGQVYELTLAPEGKDWLELLPRSKAVELAKRNKVAFEVYNDGGDAAYRAKNEKAKKERQARERAAKLATVEVVAAAEKAGLSDELVRMLCVADDNAPIGEILSRRGIETDDDYLSQADAFNKLVKELKGPALAGLLVEVLVCSNATQYSAFNEPFETVCAWAKVDLKKVVAEVTKPEKAVTPKETKGAKGVKAGKKKGVAA